MISPEIDEHLQIVGSKAGEAGLIFIGGFIPFIRKNGHLEIDESKTAVRVSNLVEAQSARVAMSLLAFLIEETRGEFEMEVQQQLEQALNKKEN